jgi:23S rRNA (uracil1939-C5)-methyltransferase
MQKSARVKIESMAFRGYGVARADRKVLFVPYSITGDEATVEIVEEKKNYSIGRIETLIRPSPWRTSPPCPYFGVCGGCQWQHIDYPVHGDLKKIVLVDILARIGRQKEIPPIKAIPSPQFYGYRVRVQLKTEQKALGYFKERSHHIIDIESCPIAHPLVNRLISLLREQRPELLPFEEVEINVSPEEGKGVIIFHPLPLTEEINDFARKLLQRHSTLKGIVISTKERSASIGNPTLTFSVPPGPGSAKRRLSLRVSPESFSQVNLEQNQALLRTVLELGDVQENETVLDLYAGTGNLTLPLALVASEVFGVEENRKAVEDARFNVEKNEVLRCRIIQGRVKEGLRNWDGKKPDLIVLDPPRAGGKEVVDQIAGLKPKRIVYVSCDPATLSRDLLLLSEKGYSPREMGLIDMFPQTYHMEVVALLKPNSIRGD